MENLTGDQPKIVHDMIGDQSVVLSKGVMDVGKAAVTKHHIELYDDTPIRQKPYWFSEPVVEAVELQCRELQALDIIEPRKSPWYSPLVPIRKKDGSITLCIDYRKLNSVEKG